MGDRLTLYRSYLYAVVITKWRRATMAAAATLFDNFAVHAVVTSGHTPDDTVYNAFMEAAQRHEVTQTVMTSGYMLNTDDGLRIEVIAPSVVPTDEAKPQDVPLVLRVRYGEASFLITSEVSEKEMARLLIGNEKLRSTVLLLPSNGSAKVNTADLIKLTMPQAAVIVAEAGNTAAMPEAVVTNTVLADIPTFRTDQNGNIEIVTDGSTLWINRTKP